MDAKDNNPETHENATHQNSSNPAEGNAQEPSERDVEAQNPAVAADATETASDSTYRCDKCDKQFESKQECELHQRMEHDQQKLYTCNVCDKTFANQSNLKIHMGTHEVCDKCTSWRNIYTLEW